MQGLGESRWNRTATASTPCSLCSSRAAVRARTWDLARLGGVRADGVQEHQLGRQEAREHPALPKLKWLFQ